MRGAIRGVTIVTGGRFVYTAKRGFTVDAAFKYLNRLIHGDLMLFDQIDILMAFTAGRRQIKRIDP